MFSGLVSGKARVQRLEQEGKTIVLTVKTVPENLAGVKIGDSIAVSGCCLTVEAFSKDSFTVTMMPQTFDKTTFKNLQAGDQVNMERSVPVGGRFEGHIVSGHVDETVAVTGIQQNENALELRFFLPDRLKKQVVPQGSVAINGTSLTVMNTGDDWFSVGLIPHTQDETNLSGLQVGNQVNLETDVLGKYVEANLAAFLKNELDK